MSNVILLLSIFKVLQGNLIQQPLGTVFICVLVCISAKFDKIEISDNNNCIIIYMIIICTRTLQDANFEPYTSVYEKMVTVPNYKEGLRRVKEGMLLAFMKARVSF